MRLLVHLASSGPNRAKRVVGLIALVGLVASVAVHLSTFLGGPFAARVDKVYPLHIGIFPLFFALVFALRAEMKGMNGMEKAELKRRLLGSVPHWGKVLFVFAFLYTPVNFFSTMAQTGGASAQQCRGEYVLTSHGRTVRKVTREEAMQHEMLMARGFSGHWMMFYLLPTLYFLARREPAAPGERTSRLVR
jgi:hypothetical protein